MDPSPSRPFINTQLAPRHPGHITPSIHEQLAPAPTEPQYTGQPSVDSQYSLSMNVDAVMRTRVPYRGTRSVDTEVTHSEPLTTHMLDVYGRQPMSPNVYTSGMHGPYTQSALRDVDPSRPAHTPTHCRQGEEQQADAGQSTILVQGYTGDSL